MTVTILNDNNAAIEANRKRYDALMLAGQSKKPRPLPSPTLRDMVLPEETIVSREDIPGGWYWAATLRRGEAIRIVNVSGTSSVAMLAWNQHDPSERFNHADTIKLQWTAVLQKGRILLSDMGRVLLSMIEDTSSVHDALAGGSTAASNAAKYAGGPYRNTRDNFILMAAKLGLDRRDLPPCLTFFAPLAVTGEGNFAWDDTKRKPGDFVDLRAEMDVAIALSNCPHPFDPALEYQPEPVTVVTFRPPPPPADNDFCRTGTEEAVRAFQNTDALFRERTA